MCSCIQFKYQYASSLHVTHVTRTQVVTYHIAVIAWTVTRYMIVIGTFASWAYNRLCQIFLSRAEHLILYPSKYKPHQNASSGGGGGGGGGGSIQT